MRKQIALLMTVLLTLTLFGCAKKAEPAVEPEVVEEPAVEETHVPTWQEQYDLGMRLLSEGNYEEAVIAFTMAAQIEPKKAEAYSSRADVFLSMAAQLPDEAASEEVLELKRKAISDYEQAQLLGQDIQTFGGAMAKVYYELGENEKGTEIERLMGIEPTLPDDAEVIELPPFDTLPDGEYTIMAHGNLTPIEGGAADTFNILKEITFTDDQVRHFIDTGAVEFSCVRLYYEDRPYENIVDSSLYGNGYIGLGDGNVNLNRINGIWYCTDMGGGSTYYTEGEKTLFFPESLPVQDYSSAFLEERSNILEVPQSAYEYNKLEITVLDGTITDCTVLYHP